MSLMRMDESRVRYGRVRSATDALEATRGVVERRSSPGRSIRAPEVGGAGCVLAGSRRRVRARGVAKRRGMTGPQTLRAAADGLLIATGNRASLEASS